MNISDLITPERVICNSEIHSKKRVIEKLSELLSAGAQGSDPADIFNRLIERERLGSTALGQGVALPHGRIPSSETTIGAFIKLDEGVDFDSPDGKPTDLIFALLVPEHHTNEHLEVLAALANMFSNSHFCNKLRACTTDLSLFTQISSWATQHSEAS